MIFGSDTKKRQNSAIWQKKVMSEKNQGLLQGTREVEVGTPLLGGDKNNVIVDKVLSYF